jgi:amino acid adenylation domain-containing protein
VGVQPGDRVTIQLENSHAAAVAIFGALKAGAVFMPLHSGTKREKVAALLADAEPSAIITDAARLREVGEAIDATSSLRCLVLVDGSADLHSDKKKIHWADLDASNDQPPVITTQPDDLAALVYTSGSTGQAKGVMCSHYNMVSVTRLVNEYLCNTEDDVILNVLPLAFGYGLYQLFLAFQVGGRVVLEKSFAFPARIVATMRDEGVTAMPAVPTFFSLLFKYPDLLKDGFPSLRYITNAGAALPTSYVEQIRRALPGVTLFSMYGQTECKRTTYLPPEELERRPSSVGVAIPGTRVYLRGEDGEPVRSGEVGELVVQGPHVMQGYWRAPELTAQKFAPGPNPGERTLFTGDLFRMDEEGYLYFVARKDDIIKSRGEKVSPKEVENAVCEMPGVAEAAVVGVPDEVLGQAVRLLVVLQAGHDISEREIRAHCIRKLEDYMQPKYVEIVADLPRTDNGKIDKLAIVNEG